jgi:MFS family permease
MSTGVANLLSAGVGAGGMSRVLVAAASDRFGREWCFTAVLVAMAIASASSPLVVVSVAGAMAYAVVIGACSGWLVALVLLLATAALATPLNPNTANGTTSTPRAAAEVAF